MPPASTAPAPATRDQVDAYRFGLRRMEAALVRGDPVLLHEQIRTQRRAVAAGVVLGVLGVLGALLTATVAPRPPWQDQDLVVGAPSGALYAVAHDPDRLVPVANAVAGRLVLAALRPAPPSPGPPVLVDDALLAAAPRTAAAAVPGAVAADPRQRLPGPWALCDEVTTRPVPRLVGTTVLAGPAAGGPVDPDGGVLLAAPDGGTWLVVDGRRHRVDPRDVAVRAAFGLTGHAPRPASPGLVSALSEGVALVTPAVPRAGAAGPRGVPGRVGDVLVSRPAGAPPRHHVVLAGGLQEVPPLVADVLAAASGDPVAEVGPEVVAGAAAVQALDVAGWPVRVPRLREPAESPVTCWSWSEARPDGEVRVGARTAAVPVALAGADGPGAAVDAVVVGTGGTVRASAPGAPRGAGTLWVMSATGVAYGVADGDTAAALGVTTAELAPESVLRLLPTGPVLDVAAADRVVDAAG